MSCIVSEIKRNTCRKFDFSHPRVHNNPVEKMVVNTFALFYSQMVRLQCRATQLLQKVQFSEEGAPMLQTTDRQTDGQRDDRRNCDDNIKTWCNNVRLKITSIAYGLEYFFFLSTAARLRHCWMTTSSRLSDELWLMRKQTSPDTLTRWRSLPAKPQSLYALAMLSWLPEAND